MSSQSSTVAPPKGERVEYAICWNELHTRNESAAKVFYPAVIGWKAHACPAAPGGHAYTEWVRTDGAHVGGMMPMPASVSAEVPSNWAVYVHVPDVDATLAKVKSLGGRVISPAKDEPHVGRLAAIADPTGAVFHVITGVGDVGARVPQSIPGSFCWTELLTHDPESVKRFYTALLGWTTTSMPMEGFEYTLLWVPGADPAKKQGCVGGMMKIQKEWGDMPSNWLSYIMVESVDAAAERATKAGGRVCSPPMDIPGVGRFATVTDPAGATFALFTGTS